MQDEPTGLRNSASSDDPDELFDIVDTQDHVIGQARRGAVHGNPSLIHRSVQVLVFDHSGRLLLQRRSRTKDLFPGYHCASASGHVAAGDDYARTAAREVSEELGVSLPLTYLGSAMVHAAIETEITAIYLARSDGPFVFHPTETDGDAFITRTDIAAGCAAGSLQLTPALQVALDALDASHQALSIGWS